MGDNEHISLDFKPAGRVGNGILTARLGDRVLAVRRLDLADADQRAAFAQQIATAHGLPVDDLEAALTNLAGQHVEDGNGGKPKQAQALVELAGGVELFHDGETAYASFVTGDGGSTRRETHGVTSRGFRLWLSRRFYSEYGRPANAQALQDALGVLGGKALFEGPQRTVAVRVGRHNGHAYLDLCDDGWRAVRITPDGWQVTVEPPVHFIRKRGMQALPIPVAGGSIEHLRPLLNAPDDATWQLLVGWLVGVMRPVGPYPVLSLNGEQGSGKSILCRMLRRTIDPNESDLRSLARDDRDLLISASNSWIVAFDNLSHIAPHVSDAICRLATGGGFATRQLYTDDEEKIFSAMRPVLLNGIDDLGGRPDLLERSIIITLPSIPDEARRTEQELWAQYEAIRPGVLGALLDAAVTAMRNEPIVHLDRLPRMADFARWVVAAEPALPWASGEFLDAYAGNRAAANEAAVESSPIGPAILKLMELNVAWTGTASELLSVLEGDGFTDARARSRREWPGTARGISNAVRRITPALRRLGLEVTFDRELDRGRRRTIRIERVGITPSVASVASANGPGAIVAADLFGRSVDEAAEAYRPTEVPF